MPKRALKESIKMKTNTSWHPETYLKAWHYATIAHEGQTYGGAQEDVRIAYINHIGSVATEVLWAIGDSVDYDSDLAIQCALLHDIIEDTNITYDDLIAKFGREVANGVLALTKDKRQTSKRGQIIDSLMRIRQQPREVWIVKMADRITNLYHPPFYWDAAKMKSYREEARLIYDELKEANEKLANRLLEKIEAYKIFIKVEETG